TLVDMSPPCDFDLTGGSAGHTKRPRIPWMGSAAWRALSIESSLRRRTPGSSPLVCERIGGDGTGLALVQAHVTNGSETVGSDAETRAGNVSRVRPGWGDHEVHRYSPPFKDKVQCCAITLST